MIFPQRLAQQVPGRRVELREAGHRSNCFWAISNGLNPLTAIINTPFLLKIMMWPVTRRWRSIVKENDSPGGQNSKPPRLGHS